MGGRFIDKSLSHARTGRVHTDCFSVARNFVVFPAPREKGSGQSYDIAESAAVEIERH